MNQPKSKSRDGRKLSFYENYYDQSGRLLYVSDDQKLSTAGKNVLLDDHFDRSKLLRDDLKSRKDNISVTKTVSDRLNYCQRNQINLTEIKNKKRHLFRMRGVLFFCWLPIWLSLGAGGVLSVLLVKIWNQTSIATIIKDSLIKILSIIKDFKLFSLCFGYVLLGLFAVLTFYLVLRRFKFSDDHKYTINHSKFRQFIKFISLLSSLLIGVTMVLLNELVIPDANATIIFWLWIVSFVAGGLFVIVSLMFILIKFFYRKKRLVVDEKIHHFDLIDLKIKY